MKKIILTLFLVVICGTASAQYFSLTSSGMVSKADSAKTYVVLEFPEKPQAELFDAAKSYIITAYNSAKDVMSTSETEKISVLAVFVDRGVLINYKYVLTFKDGKIKVDYIVGDMRPEDLSATWKVSLIRPDVMSCGVFDKKGKPLSRQIPTKAGIEAHANNLTRELVDAINGDTTDEDW